MNRHWASAALCCPGSSLSPAADPAHLLRPERFILTPLKLCPSPRSLPDTPCSLCLIDGTMDWFVCHPPVPSVYIVGSSLPLSPAGVVPQSSGHIQESHLWFVCPAATPWSQGIFKPRAGTQEAGRLGYQIITHPQLTLTSESPVEATNS